MSVCGCLAVAIQSATEAVNSSTDMPEWVAVTTSISAASPPSMIAFMSPAAAAFSAGVDAQAGSAAAFLRAWSSAKKNWK